MDIDLGNACGLVLAALRLAFELNLIADNTNKHGLMFVSAISDKLESAHESCAC